METFWLYHLAACWNGRKGISDGAHAPPLATGPVQPTTSQPSTAKVILNALAGHNTVIRAAAAQMVFASRTSQDFITPEQVAVLEEWTAKVCLSFLLGASRVTDMIARLGRPRRACENDYCTRRTLLLLIEAPYALTRSPSSVYMQRKVACGRCNIPAYVTIILNGR
jgi:hypothetical protein